MKATLDTRITQIREEYEQSETKLKHLVAEQLKEAAARLEKCGVTVVVLLGCRL
jgi:hypothetical protein